MDFYLLILLLKAYKSGRVSLSQRRVSETGKKFVTLFLKEFSAL